MNEYFIEQQIKDLTYDLEIIREKCFCGKGEIVKIKTYELVQHGNYFRMEEVKKVKEFTCEFCEANYNSLNFINMRLEEIKDCERRLINHKYQNLSDKSIQAIEEETCEIMKAYDAVKVKLEQFNITTIPYANLTKHQWANYFVENKLTDLDEKQCYKQLFYGSDKIGINVFLETIGITINEYKEYIRGNALSYKLDKEKELKERIAICKHDIATKKGLVEAVLKNKSKISNFDALDTLEIISTDFERITEEHNKKREEEWQIVQKEREEVYKQIEEDYLYEDTLSSDFYDKSELAFHIEEALTYTLNKISNDKSILTSEDDKKSFISNYICDTIGNEYIPNDTFENDDDDFDDEYCDFDDEYDDEEDEENELD